MLEMLLPIKGKVIPPRGWKKLANMPVTRTVHCSVGVGNLVYIVGGNATGGNYRTDLISYNVDTQEYITLAPMPTGRFSFGMAVIDNKIYVYGGQQSGGLNATLDCYDIALGTWSTLNLAIPPAGRREHGMVAYNGKLYVAGGSTSATTGVKETWCYDPVANTWTRLADMLVGGYAAIFEVIGDYLYYLAGRSPTTTVKTVYRFDPNDGATGKWIQLADLSSILIDSCFAKTPEGIYIFGGIDTALNNKLSLFNGVTKTDIAMPATLPTARYQASMAVVRGQLYVNGGNTSGLIVPDMWQATV